jgi:hypothetical protein
VDALWAVGEDLKYPEVNPIIASYSLNTPPYLINSTNIQPLPALCSSSAASAGMLSAALAVALSVDSADALLAGAFPAGLELASPVEPVSLARRSKRLEGVHRQYVVAELFPSISDTEDDDDGVEFCWRDEA